MSLRELVNRNPQIGVVIAAVVAILAIGIMATRGGRSDAEQYKYGYYLLPDSGELIVDVSGQVSPLDNGAVRAVVFSCGDCSDKNTHVLAWVERYTDQAKQAMIAVQNMPEPEDPTKAPVMREETMLIEHGRLIALPPNGGGELQWVQASSPAGIAVMRTARQNCRESMDMCAPLPSERP